MIGISLTKSQKRAIRKAVGARLNMPIAVIPNSYDPPKIEGEGWHYTTASGRRITYPNAYRRVGWSNMYYSPSTLRIVVGEKWVIDNLM